MTRTSLSHTSRHNTIHATLLVFAICCATTALGQGAAPPATAKAPAMNWIGDLDRNHDGRITAQEAAAVPAMAQSFAALDANHDGAISMSEVRVFWRQRAMGTAQGTFAAAFTKADSNHDGKLTPDEAKAGMPRVAAAFKNLDANHDGTLSKEEVAAASQMAAQAALAQKRQGEAQLFAKADTNHDGKLSQAEFTAAFPKLAPSFGFFDENHDGAVVPDEFALPPR